MRRVRLLLADDHTLVMEGLKRILQPHFELVGTAQDGQAVVTEAGRLKPDVILLDISMPVLNGIDAAGQLRKIVPEAKLIFLTMHEDPTYVASALRVGASGYLVKRCAAEELVTAIREVLKGRTYVTRFVRKQTLNRQLTSREREVLQLVAEGQSVKEIAATLAISGKTVAFHKTNIMRKVCIDTTAGLTRYAIEHGISKK
jgi:DNA-binding NarL/FixJ family response regulator